MPVLVRRATIEDLTTVHQLIRDSFVAMAEHPSLLMRLMMGGTGEQTWLKMANAAIEKELTEQTFELAYSGQNCFWVAVDSDSQRVVGCVGLKREGESSSAELVRMAVEKKGRGKGVGQVLMQHLAEHAKSQGVLELHLKTGNPRSAYFYEKSSFTRNYLVWILTGATLFAMRRIL
jgi:N-acetylglutamate synthase-like GNAT family acetyltransferase